MTDPRFLNATTEDMLLDLWTVHYARQAARGEGVTEFEDDSFDVDAFERLLGQADPDDWEELP